MKVFFSHSGERSLQAAKLLANWTNRLIQSTQPWLSEEIQKGARWREELARALEDTRVGIICLTRENLGAPWIHYEAGAIGRTPGGLVCTFLLGVESRDVREPLGTFEHTRFERNDLFRLIRDIRSEVEKGKEPVLPETAFQEEFDVRWDALESALRTIKEASPPTPPTRRDPEDVLSDILETVRRIERGQQPEALEKAYRGKLWELLTRYAPTEAGEGVAVPGSRGGSGYSKLRDAFFHDDFRVSRTTDQTPGTPKDPGVDTHTSP